MKNTGRRLRLTRSLVAAAVACALLGGLAACRKAEKGPSQPTFASPEEAVRALIQAVRGGKTEDVLAIFGPDGQAIVDSSDPVTARRNRDIFTVAVAEKWRLEDQGPTARTLVIGNEEWPFPIPLVKEENAWRFDAAAGREEILARRIGRNELAVMRICQTYVAAQGLYAERGHDGQRAGLYARKFRSDAGRQDGLFWPAKRGEKRSPLGDLVAHAAAEGRPVGGDGQSPAPFHGYYFRILTAQGAAAQGGARDYIVNGTMSGGFALVAWPSHYDVTGIMTFVINQDGILREKDLGPETDAVARGMTLYDPDPSWTSVQ